MSGHSFSIPSARRHPGQDAISVEFNGSAGLAAGTLGEASTNSRLELASQIAYEGIKRAIDIVVCGLALLILSPIIAAIAVAIKLHDRGPVFFTQTRAGRMGVTS